LFVSGCGAQGSHEQDSAKVQATGAYPELEELLQNELQRLDRLSNRDSASAPNGISNAVFDLSASLVEQQLAEQQPLAVRLSWTERSIGDYDGNGEVNVADLTPLGQNLGESVAYRNP